MGVLELTFLGKPYELPEDLLAYIRYHKKFENLRQSLLSSMLKWHGSNPKSANFDPNKKHFQFVAQQCVSLLFEKGIYSKTEDDFLTDNEGLNHYDKSLYQTQMKRLDIEIAKVEGLLSAIDNAEQVAAQNITGMGFSVISSSIIELGVWAAMESSTVKKQASEADRLYSEMVGSAISRGDDLASQQVAQLVKSYWLPNLKESIDAFIAIVFDRFIKHLIENGKFDEAALDYLDAKRAEMIVKNISVASDKKQLLREAFSKCPFTLCIYTEVIRLGEFTTDECNAARIFGLLDDIASDNKERAVRIARVMEVPESSIISQLTHHASIAALINNTSPEEAIADFLALRRKTNIHKLEMLQTMDGKSRKFDQLMRESVASTVTGIINIAESDQQLSDLFCNYISIKVLLSDDSTFYDSYKEKTVNALVTKADAYINEAYRRHSEYKKSESSYLRIQRKVEEQIASLNAERRKLGFFAFFRRAEIDEEIPALQKKEEEAKQAMLQVKKHFEQMYK